jgi:hypothetical protein
VRDYERVIIEALRDAGLTLMQSDMPARGKPREFGNYWPDYQHRFWDLWSGIDEEERKKKAAQINEVRIRPSNKQQDKCNEALEWLWCLEPRYRRVVFARSLVNAHTRKPIYSWRRLAELMDVSHQCLKRDFDTGIEQIILHLSQKSS